MNFGGDLEFRGPGNSTLRTKMTSGKSKLDPNPSAFRMFFSMFPEEFQTIFGYSRGVLEVFGSVPDVFGGVPDVSGGFPRFLG